MISKNMKTKQACYRCDFCGKICKDKQVDYEDEGKVLSFCNQTQFIKWYAKKYQLRLFDDKGLVTWEEFKKSTG